MFPFGFLRPRPRPRRLKDLKGGDRDLGVKRKSKSNDDDDDKTIDEENPEERALRTRNKSFGRRLPQPHR